MRFGAYVTRTATLWFLTRPDLSARATVFFAPLPDEAFGFRTLRRTIRITERPARLQIEISSRPARLFARGRRRNGFSSTANVAINYYLMSQPILVERRPRCRSLPWQHRP